MQDQQQFKCPNCNGSIQFESSLQKMKCPYCDTEFEPEALKGLDEDLREDGEDQMEWDAAPGKEWEAGEAEELISYSCDSCGGEIVGDRTLAATTCPYCDSPVVLQKQFAGMLKPDLVIPFRLDKTAAKEAMKKHLQNKRLLNKAFKDENHIDEIKGIYVPFWLFNTKADGRARYRGTRVRHWSDANYNYTATSFYSVVRAGHLGFCDVPVDGSQKMADDLMESLEPFHLKDGVDFATAYLAGFFADRYDVDAEQSIARANERIRQSTEEALRATAAGYHSLICESSSVSFSEGSARYALFPVWLLNTTWRGEKYVFAMNGQTGKFVGNLPVDKSLWRKWMWGVCAAVTGALTALQFLLWLL